MSIYSYVLWLIVGVFGVFCLLELFRKMRTDEHKFEKDVASIVSFVVRNLEEITKPGGKGKKLNSVITVFYNHLPSTGQMTIVIRTFTNDYITEQLVQRAAEALRKRRDNGEKIPRAIWRSGLR